MLPFCSLVFGHAHLLQSKLGLRGGSCKIVRDSACLGFGETSVNLTYQILLSEELGMLYWVRNAGFTAFTHDSSHMRLQLIYA